ncbi:ATP-binding protein [Halocatena salina]|uniref:histidine kinase n=1 Tax=Halocatena salina TaxID=2934340 RepID=A0A8U0A1Q5_9EURY|nr:ATP-binding protein [Halocatena salina]UPM43085.1 ATP-binding protein [Halocatena salina]
MTNRLGRRDRLWRWGSAIIIGGCGVVTGAIQGLHFVTDSPESLPTIAYSIVLPLCLSVGLIAAGWWTGRSNLPAPYTLRIASWSIAGGGVFSVSGGMMIRYQQSMGIILSDQLFVIINVITGGMAIGFAFGLYAIRIKRQATQLDRYQHRLERERDRFVALFDNLPDPVVQYDLTDDTAVIRVVNPAFERLFDVDGTAAHGTPVRQHLVLSNLEQSAIDLDATLHADTVVQHEVRLKTAVGIRDFRLLVIPPQVATEQTGHIIAADITDRNQHVRRLEVLNRVLRHDLRNAAGIILGSTDLLNERLSEQTQVETIYEAASDLVELSDTVGEIENALDCDQRTNGPIALREVLTSCIEQANDDYPDADVRLDSCVDGQIPVIANDRIDVALENIIENAVEHNDSDQPAVSITVSNKISDFVSIEIADNGPGIPKRERNVIEQGSESQHHHSLGLGLWFVNWIVVDSGGNVTFDDNEPRGSIVTIHLPSATLDHQPPTPSTNIPSE